MVQGSSVKLSFDLDMKTALRLARFEVETGVSLDQLLVRAVEEWERANPSLAKAPVDARVPVYFNYSPRNKSNSGKQTTYGRYEVARNEVEITEAAIASLVGQRGSPSEMAMAIVRAFNPSITASNRSGPRDWKQAGSGRPIKDILRGTPFKTRESPPAVDLAPVGTVRPGHGLHAEAEMASWREDIKTALRILGGAAPLVDIYREVRAIRPSPHPASLEAIVRGTLETHSSDSSKFDGGEDTFYSVHGLGSGVWGLR